MRRRRVLTTIAAGSLGGLAGCAASDDATVTTSTGDDATPTVTRSPTDSPTATSTSTPEPGAVVVAQRESFDPLRASVAPGETVVWLSTRRGERTPHTR